MDNRGWRWLDGITDLMDNDVGAPDQDYHTHSSLCPCWTSSLSLKGESWEQIRGHLTGRPARAGLQRTGGNSVAGQLGRMSAPQVTAWAQLSDQPVTV